MSHIHLVDGVLLGAVSITSVLPTKLHQSLWMKHLCIVWKVHFEFVSLEFLHSVM
jgi:hypothetical protein